MTSKHALKVGKSKIGEARRSLKARQVRKAPACATRGEDTPIALAQAHLGPITIAKIGAPL